MSKNRKIIPDRVCDGIVLWIGYQQSMAGRLCGKTFLSGVRVKKQWRMRVVRMKMMN